MAPPKVHYSLATDSKDAAVDKMPENDFKKW